MTRILAAKYLLAASAAAICASAGAQPGENETTKFKYDALGRLVETTTTGTINNGLRTKLCYDPAGNRSLYAVAGSAGPAPPPPPCPPPSPPPPPPPPPPPGSPQ